MRLARGRRAPCGYGSADGVWDDERARDLSNPVSTLSESQKICLRRVGSGMSSKEIAIETGWAPQTVDTYIKAAMARLGASNRREAARLLAHAELSQKLG